MKDVTLTESVIVRDAAPEFMDRIAAELARAGGEILRVDSEHVVFTGDRRPGSWRLLGGISDGSVRRTVSGVDVVASFPAIYPVAGLVGLVLAGALVFRITDWSIALLMVAILPLFLALVLRRQMKSIAALIVRANCA